ncbi:hypothetical protein ACOMCU_01830 [Lysinibacillus sp. UGB7]|uniref:hypothetical protein n=1 Tax=Lysinibacillus sp. UGB7 TaxID=3411039 RepID=UPI003B77C700
MYPKKKDLIIGLLVEIRIDKTADDYTKGYISRFVSTNKKEQVKVELTNGSIGIVERIIPAHELKKENFKFYNELIHARSLYSIWDNNEKLYHCTDSNNGSRYCFIYEQKDLLQAMIKKLKLDNKQFTIRALPKNKSFLEIFRKQEPTSIIINGTRKISFEKLIELQNRFN